LAAVREPQHLDHSRVRAVPRLAGDRPLREDVSRTAGVTATDAARRHRAAAADRVLLPAPPRATPVPTLTSSPQRRLRPPHSAGAPTSSGLGPGTSAVCRMHRPSWTEVLGGPILLPAPPAATLPPSPLCPPSLPGGDDEATSTSR